MDQNGVVQACAQGLLGGILLGLASSINLGLLGRITGMSGIVFNALRLQKNNWPAIVSGITFAGSVAHLKYGWSSESPFGLKEQVSAGRSLLGFVVSGFLVGFGTKFGNGCTSGHGVCGLPRFSKRSLAAVLTFMGVGVTTATLASKYSLGPLSQTSVSQQLVDSKLASTVMAGISLAVFAGYTALAYARKNAISSIIGFAVGSIFSTGLLLSGMTRRANILGFLALTEAWNPALMCVMGGAVGFNLLTFRYILKQKKPLLAQEFILPKKTAIDLQLIAGAAVFGLGWGIGGLCPGPALVLSGLGDVKIYAWMASLSAGMLAGSKAEQSLEPAKQKSK